MSTQPVLSYTDPKMSGPEESAALIGQLISLKDKVASGDESATKEALQLSRKLTVALDEPGNVAVELAFSQFNIVAARIAVDLGLFRLISDHDGAITSGELASLSGGEELLIVRILRPLATNGLLLECGERTWRASPVTKAMATEGIAAGHRMLGEMVMGAAQKAPKYLKEVGYHCPTDPNDGFMQYAFQTKLTTFELFNSIPRVSRDFNLFMGNTMGARDYWVDWFPVEERLLSGASITDKSALLVDVGGGRGHDVLAFRDKFPQRGGRLILEDLAPALENVEDLGPEIETVVYDFFTPQPIKGARAYFYHHILHDWSDYKCLQILEQVTAAMKPGYSKLLLHEMIVPEQGASRFHAMLDMTMMSFNAGMERTEKQWKALLERAGLVVVKTWPPVQPDADGIVEAMLME
ncbi:putative O-methyltransferase [Xylariomycetidae sp. FL0641]|nr:putative O-methyltransferase [Xylariomycetidae sp. FL0641]